MSTPAFVYQEPLSLGADETEYRLLSPEGVTTTQFEGREILKIAPEALTCLAREAFHDANFYLRTKHLEQLGGILQDPEASANDRYVALTLLKNAEIAAHGILPMCQDTGTAAIFAKKGQEVWTGGNDAAQLAQGVYECYTRENLRYSQIAPLGMFQEVNTGTNLPAHLDLHATDGAHYAFLFVAKHARSPTNLFSFPHT